MQSSLYPESPQNITKELTKLPSSYQFRAFLAILSIVLFFILYFSLVAALGYLVYLTFTTTIGGMLIQIGSIAAAVMLFVFTLKFIFKLQNHKPNNRIKLNKEEHPELMNFVNKICEETGAPKPRSIYVDPDVNAYVNYSNIWLSLILPVKKDLTIGLGLVSCLTLTEFKAVITHEFGHFAQRSMKIGSYIISANTIIHDMIFNRDKWDNLLAQWRTVDLRLSFAAWIITPVIWLIRQTLNLFYQFLNIMYSSLSREMEFNADKVAVSTSGSDAIISALWKLDNGAMNWNETMNHAYLASQKKLFVKNLYQHNSLALARTAPEQNELFEQLPMDKRGGKHFFSNSENSKVHMYASHPPNDLRENNAKNPYIDCAVDERSPWLLFSNNVSIQESMTAKIYEIYLNKTITEFSSEADFEAFIEAETKGKELLKEYHNTFEHRFLTIPEKDALKVSAAALVDIQKSSIKTLKSDLTALMKPVQDIEKIMEQAANIAQGTSKENSFSFEGRTYQKKEIEEGYNTLFQQREKLFNEHFKDWDSNFCAIHLSLAIQHQKEIELTNLYQQHHTLSIVFRAFANVKSTIHEQLFNLQNRGDVEQDEINTFEAKVKGYVVELNDIMKKFDDVEFVELPNIETREELKEAIWEGATFTQQYSPIFENGGFDQIMMQLENAIAHCQRLDQKSIAAILLFHKSLHLNLN